MPRSTIRAVATVGIDMGKNTLHIIGLDSRGAIVLREKVSRGRISSRLANLPPCLIGIEAGMATHYVARELAALGHDVKQVPPTYAKPFRQGHKNDFRDAHAVAEAVQRPTTRFVPAKSDEQLDLCFGFEIRKGDPSFSSSKIVKYLSHSMRQINQSIPIHPSSALQK